MPVEEQVKENQAEEKVGSEQAWLQQQNKLTSLAISIDSSKEADGESASKVENVSIMPLEVAFCETMMEQSLALGALSHLSAVLYPLLIYQEDIHSVHSNDEHFMACLTACRRSNLMYSKV